MLPGRPRHRAPRATDPMALEIDVVTLFPAMVRAPLSESIPARIQERGLVAIRVHDLRDWGLGRHRSVDDATYGGGAGMVLRPEPVAAALDQLRRTDSTAILLDPAGERFGQARAHDAGRSGPTSSSSAPATRAWTSGFARLVDLELSIGDYVLTGGELPALVIIDAVIRLLPGAIDAESTTEESFATGLLEYPQYTRPPSLPGMPTCRRSWCPVTTVRSAPGACANRSAGRWCAGRTCSKAERPPGKRPGSLPRSGQSSSPGGGRGLSSVTCRARGAASQLTRRAQCPCYTPPSVAHGDASTVHDAAPRCQQQVRNRPVNVLDEIVADQLRSDLPELASGDTVRVAARVVEGNRERIQVFEGTVMRLRGGGITRSITVRRIASGVGVERTFKIHSPRIDKIEVVRHGQVRRAQLYFLRDRVGKAATLRERRPKR